jgi:FAD/FMN-containing dehydrogenase
MQAIDGHVLLEKAPDEFKQRNDVFGSWRPEWPLMHRVKVALDPHRVFSPGTLPGRG